MANKYTTIHGLFTAIADAIRSKNSSTEAIVADNFPTEIENIKSGFDYNNHNITTISDYEFYGCEDLNSMNCYNLTSIGTSAFENCTRFKTVILYDGVESVGENAFKGCSKLTIYCEAESKPETWHENWNPDNCEVVWGYAPVETWDISKTEDDNVIAELYANVDGEKCYLLKISGTGKMKDYGSNDAPWDGYKRNIFCTNILHGVTNIGTYAFYRCSSLTSVAIPDSITSINEYAFAGCDNLTSVMIPDSVTCINDNAFAACISLTSIVIPNSVTSIGNQVFYNCYSLNSIAIPDSVISIGTRIFENTPYYNDISNWENDVFYVGNHLLKAKSAVAGDYVVRDGTKNISGYVFYNCQSLTSITIPDSVVSIGDYAFYNCSALASITIPDSVTSIGSYAFNGCTSLTSITIPDSITSIGDSMFGRCTSLTSITIPDSVTSIGDSAFNRCSKLASITIPDSVTSIGGYAFEGTEYYQDYSNWENDVLYIGNHLIKVKDMASSEYRIRQGTLVIGDKAFKQLFNLTSITIPDSVVSIGDSAFEGCSGLTSITIPDSVVSIEQYAFLDCKSLTSITIPDSVVNIYGLAFIYCSALTSITYTGTIAQWNAITKVASWNDSTGNYTIHCTDGDIAKDGTITYHATTE